jgi:hypothetical protein
MLPELIHQITPEQEIATVTADGAIAPSPPEVPPPSFHPARMPNRGNPTRPGLSHATRSCAHQSVSVEPSGGDGAPTTAEAKPRQDATRQVAGPAPVRTRVRSSGRRVPGPCRCAQRLHRARHAHHRAAGLVCPGKGEARPSPDLCSRAPCCGKSIPKTGRFFSGVD